MNALLGPHVDAAESIANPCGNQVCKFKELQQHDLWKQPMTLHTGVAAAAGGWLTDLQHPAA